MKGGFNQYAPMAGVMKLREAIAEKIQLLYGAKLNPETQITITSGATQAIFTAITAIVGVDDEVIVIEPAYDCYVPAIHLAGANPVYAETEYPDYKINWESVKKLVTQRTRLIIINTPHNPTGSVLNENDMKQLEKITRNSDIFVLSDEVYEHIIFDKLEHQSVLRYPNLAERSIAVFSFGKTYHPTGWKIGYAIGPDYLMKEFRKVHQFNVFCTNTPMQHALADFMHNRDEYLLLNSFYEEKRNQFNRLFKGSKFKVRPSVGTYFQLLDYSKISKEGDKDFAIRLTKDHGVASIPISVFYRNNIDAKVLRFCFAKSAETLEQAAERLCKI
jgi:methionine aminotransferase